MSMMTLTPEEKTEILKNGFAPTLVWGCWRCADCGTPTAWPDIIINCPGCENKNFIRVPVGYILVGGDR